MIDFRSASLSSFITDPTPASQRHAMICNSARSMFNKARMKGTYTRLAYRILGRDSRLKVLEIGKGDLLNSAYGGLKEVEISRIIGTESRNNEFDCLFHPMKQWLSQRWMSIAMARLEYIGLPAVDLIKVEDVFYVRDGHHRVSVYRAMGQEIIEANIYILNLV
jgi:hypothetical protein